MPGTHIESFCERCGTKYAFEQPAQRARMLKGLGRTLGILPDDAAPEAAAAVASRDPFHGVFRFCLECRQYTCPSCWNEAEGFCQGCAPLPESPDMGDLEAVAALEAATHVRDALAEIKLLGTVESWPNADLPEPEPELLPELVAEAVPGAPVVEAPVAAEPEELLVAFDEPAVVPQSVAHERVLAAELRHAADEVRAAEERRAADALASEERLAEEEPFVAVEPIAVAEAEAEVVAEPAAESEAEVAAEPEAEVVAEPEAEVAAEPEVLKPAAVGSGIVVTPDELFAAPWDDYAGAADGEEAEADEDWAALAPPPAPVVEPEVLLVAAEAEPEPVIEPEPEPMFAIEPEPVAAIAAPEPGPSAAEADAEPLPVAAVAEPEPVPAFVAEPEPVAEPVPAVVAEPEPLPVTAVAEPEPLPVAAIAEPAPALVAEPEPIPLAAAIELEPEPVAEPGAEPVPMPVLVRPEPAPEPAPELPLAAISAEPPTAEPVAPSQIPSIVQPPVLSPTVAPASRLAALFGRGRRPVGDEQPSAAPEPRLASGWQVTAPDDQVVWPPRAPVYEPPDHLHQAAGQAPSRPSLLGRANLAAGSSGAHGGVPSGIRPCFQCALPLSATARFCRRCGTPQQPGA
jgi:hypothetical protein